MIARRTYISAGTGVGHVVLTLLVILGGLASPATLAQDSAWTSLDEGLDLGRFRVNRYAPFGDSIITILRIEPDSYEFILLSAGNTPDSTRRTVERWCEDFNLTAAINAGMYNLDRLTHIGYMKSGGYINSRVIVRSDYRSAVAFHPVDDSLPEVRMYDLDETPIEALIAGYGTVVQNIRLIKRSGENRWPEKPEKWSETALGEDSEGRILMIFCKTPYTMHDFNDLLLSLPIGLGTAQHLEGGVEAQLYIDTGQSGLSFHGTHASGLTMPSRAIPNVIGIRRRSDSK